MHISVTGAFGRCGTALIDYLNRDEYIFSHLDLAPPPEDHKLPQADVVTANVTNEEALNDVVSGTDAIIHLAAYPHVDGSWSDVLEPNFIGTYHVLEAARRNKVETVVFASSNHVMGLYERDWAPAVYHADHDFELDHTDPVRPDSLYGVSKSYGEDIGRYYVESYDYPDRFYALRIGSVRHEPYDHPYGDAEKGVETGEFDRDSDEYQRAVARMKATWQSRRDFAQLVARCLEEPSASFDIYYGVSDNDRRWFDIDHAKEAVGYEPQDNAESWTEPPI